MLFLHTASHADRSIVGGKAARLIELIHLGFSVKPGVVFDVEQVTAFRESDLPVELIEHMQLNQQHGFAVRSSATDEDGAYSWAGQFESILSVSLGELATALVQCAAAQRSPAVIAYAAENDLPIPELALIVQEMVPASVAGVLFTRHPNNGHHEMVIEVVAGLADTLVSGARQPKRYHLQRDTGELVQEDGASRPELSHQDRQRLFKIGRQLEAHFGCAQDIEWAIDDDGALFVNQCRDVTTYVQDLEAIREQAINEARAAFECERKRLAHLGLSLNEDVYSDQNVGELLGAHPTDMTFGLFTHLFGHDEGAIRTGRRMMGYDVGCEIKDGFFVLIGGQPRVSIVHDALSYRLKGMSLAQYAPAIAFYLREIHGNPRLANYPEVGLYHQTGEMEWLQRVFGNEQAAEIARAYADFHWQFSDIVKTLDRQTIDTWRPQWRSVVGALADLHATPSQERSFLVLRLRMCLEALRTDACRQFVRVARVGFFAYDRLRRTLQVLFEKRADEYLNILTAGISSELNPNLSFSTALWDMKNGLCGLTSVMEEFGHLGVHELDIVQPRYCERPELLVRMAERLQRDPREELGQSVRSAMELRRRLLAELGDHEASVLDDLINVARRYLPLREVVKFEFLRGIDLVRQALLELNTSFAWEDGLIFHLDPTDLLFDEDVEDPSRLRALALARRQIWNAYRQLYVPTVVFSDRFDEIGRPPQLSGEQVLIGIGVTSYIAEGTVVVIESVQDVEAIDQLQSGSIIVTALTDPAWTPVLAIVGAQGALVTEVGGLLAHGAIYAREMGIAAVLNVPSATALLKTGMRVRVNGQTGTVEILN